MGPAAPPTHTPPQSPWGQGLPDLSSPVSKTLVSSTNGKSRNSGTQTVLGLGPGAAVYLPEKQGGQVGREI
jgi:hypothetical protein